MVLLTTLGDVKMITLTEIVELNRCLDEWVYGPEGCKRFSGKNETMKKAISEMVKFVEIHRLDDEFLYHRSSG